MPAAQKPMRIALTIHALYGGGAERLMSELANRWSAKHEVHLVTWADVKTDNYPLSPRIARYGLDLMRSSKGFLSGLSANMQRVSVLRKTLQRIEPDFILSFSDQMNIVALQASRSMRVPRWISEHSDPQKQRLGFLWESWRRQVYPTCTGCVVLTSDIAGYMSHLIPASRIRVIPPSIHSTPFATRSKSENSTHTLLFVGRLSREKRLDLLLDAWREISPQLPDWELRLVGDGEERTRLESHAAGTKSIKFAGWAQDPQSHYQSADIFVLSSDYEGFPVALLEAMSCGLPCISTACSSAIGELNSPTQCVVTVPRNSWQELASAILDLARNSERARDLGARCRQSARRFQWDGVGPLWDALLSETAGNFYDAGSLNR